MRTALIAALSATTIATSASAVVNVTSVQGPDGAGQTVLFNFTSQKPLVSLYWAGAMLGRFASAAVFKRIKPANLLTMTASGAVILSAVAITTSGVVAALVLLTIGLCNAVMYPTLYALALPVAPEAAPIGSMLLCMAVVAGAVVPVATGDAADAVGLSTA